MWDKGPRGARPVAQSENNVGRKVALARSEFVRTDVGGGAAELAVVVVGRRIDRGPGVDARGAGGELFTASRVTRPVDIARRQHVGRRVHLRREDARLVDGRPSGWEVGAFVEITRA